MLQQVVDEHCDVTDVERCARGSAREQQVDDSSDIVDSESAVILGKLPQDGQFAGSGVNNIQRIVC